MITMKSVIKTALVNDSTLVSKLGGKPSIYAVRAPNAEEYPRITYFELSNSDANHADDAAYSSRLVYQVDVWSRINPDPIAIEVDRVMKSIGFVLIGSMDLFEKDIQVFHRASRYGIIKEV